MDKPNFKKCQNCGAYGEQNRSCKYFAYDIYEEVKCNYFNEHKYSKKKMQKTMKMYSIVSVTKGENVK